MLRKILIAISIIAVCLSAFAVPASAKNTAVSNVQDAMKMCLDANEDIFRIAKCTLYNEGRQSGTIYMIFLSGSNMKWDKKDPQGLQVCLRSGFSLGNIYLDSVISAAKKNIPEKSHIALIGHSLGGMIAQQFAADKEMKKRYEIINVLTMGSPYIIEKETEGEIHRMVDSGDAVPYLSAATIANFFAGNYSYERNGYFGNPAAAHFDSYQSGEKWLKYDCFGIKNGKSEIIIRSYL